MPFFFLFAFLTFLWLSASTAGRISPHRYSVSSPPFSAQNVPAVMPTISKVLLYFSFLPVKQRDFPGNVRSGGCDSLPLVVAFTSKQHDSLLSYALHFLHIISHQMCCAGERAEGYVPLSVQKSLHLPLGRGKRKVQDELSQRSGVVDCQGQQQVCFVVNPVPKRQEEKQRVQMSQLCIYHSSMSSEVFDLLFILGELWAPRLPAGSEVQPWAWPDASL